MKFARMAVLPKEIFVRWDHPANDPPWLNAGEMLDDVLRGEDGPHDVGVYRLVETRRVQKITQILQTKK